MKFHDISNDPLKLLAMTGCTLDEFNALLPWFKEALFKSKSTLQGIKRTNQTVNYKNSALYTITEKIFLSWCISSSIPLKRYKVSCLI